jgi:hypothetical protein
MVPEFRDIAASTCAVPAFCPSVVPRLRHVHARLFEIVFQFGFIACGLSDSRHAGRLATVRITAKKGFSMLYAVLAYHHVESEVMSLSAEADAALMANLRKAHDRLNQVGRLGPAARLDETKKARTLRGPGDGMMIDGPFAETKEQLLGFYVVDFPDEDAAEDAVRHLRRANPSAVYEVRPIKLFIPGAAFPETAAES